MTAAGATPVAVPSPERLGNPPLGASPEPTPQIGAANPDVDPPRNAEAGRRASIGSAPGFGLRLGHDANCQNVAVARRFADD